MIILPKAIFNSHNVILSPRRKAMSLNKDQKMNVYISLFLKNFSQAFFYNLMYILTAILAAVCSYAVASHCYVPFGFCNLQWGLHRLFVEPRFVVTTVINVGPNLHDTNYYKKVLFSTLWQKIFIPKTTLFDEEVLFSTHFWTGIFVISEMHHRTPMENTAASANLD